jgi:histidinol-phosphate aminotransferase
MTSALDLVNEHIRAMPPYHPIVPLEVLSEELGLPLDALVKLDANENPYGPLPQVLAALANLDNVHIYPDPENRRLRRLLAAYHGISEDSIVVGAGEDELLDLIMRVFVTPGDVLLNCPPTFGMYAFDGALYQARVVNVPRKADFSLDIEAIEQAVPREQPKLLFLANPNNPDGGVIDVKIIERLLALPLVLVMDEAYIHFAEGVPSLMAQVKERENLIVLRTFSKWAGLAGLRVGYGVFPAALVPVLMKAKQPYTVSVAAETAACATIEQAAALSQRTQQILNERRRLTDALRRIAWLRVYPSQSNFVLCRVLDRPARAVKEYLRRQGILIRYFDSPGLQDHIRISVGSGEQTDRLTAALTAMEV